MIHRRPETPESNLPQQETQHAGDGANSVRGHSKGLLQLQLQEPLPYPGTIHKFNSADASGRGSTMAVPTIMVYPSSPEAPGRETMNSMAETIGTSSGPISGSEAFSSRTRTQSPGRKRSNQPALSETKESGASTSPTSSTSPSKNSLPSAPADFTEVPGSSSSISGGTNTAQESRSKGITTSLTTPPSTPPPTSRDINQPQSFSSRNRASPTAPAQSSNNSATPSSFSAAISSFLPALPTSFNLASLLPKLPATMTLQSIDDEPVLPSSSTSTNTHRRKSSLGGSIGGAALSKFKFGDPFQSKSSSAGNIIQEEEDQDMDSSGEGAGGGAESRRRALHPIRVPGSMANPRHRWSMDLVLEEASANGEMFDEDLVTSPTDVVTDRNEDENGDISSLASASHYTNFNGGNKSQTQPPPDKLQRRPSQAFMTASQTGAVNPLTLQAIARKESEAEAFRVIRQREDRDRKYTEEGFEEAAAEAGGGNGRPPLGRKQSWTVARGKLVRVDSSSSLGSGARTPRGNNKVVDLPGSVAAFNSITRTPDRGHLPSMHHSDLQALSIPMMSPPTTASTEGSDGPHSPLTPASDPMRPPPSVESRDLLGRTIVLGDNALMDPSGQKKKKSGFFSRLAPKKAIVTIPTPLKKGDGGITTSGKPPMNSPTSVSEGSADLPSTEKNGRVEKGKEADKIRYVKVKSKNKVHKDFGKLFLAQELFISNGPATPTGLVPNASGGDAESIRSFNASVEVGDDASIHSTSASPQNAATTSSETGMGRKRRAVWAMKFSNDGRYLAVGGKDGVVRVWQVLTSPEDRKAAMQDVDSDLASAEKSPTKESAQGTPGTKSRKRKSSTATRTPVCVMPVFSKKPLREFQGHTNDVLDLDWSKNNFLLTSSMDKTVRLWHISRPECLCAFQHLDFVTSIAFHPKDDRFFLSGSLDCKLRLWNIPEKRVQIWTELPELITSVSFTSDGKLAIGGSFNGICMFFEVETFRYHMSFAAKSARGKNSKGKKITSMVSFPLPSSGGERLLVTSNDSRLRLYHVSDKAVEAKYAGHENTSSQIRASFSDDGRYIISGSEDRHVYIWDSGLLPKEGDGWSLLKKKETLGYESFSMSSNVVTCASFAPSATRDALMQSEDPVFSNGHTYLAPLQATLTGASLALTEDRLVAVSSINPDIPSMAEHAIIVVADDSTGIISIFRNSPLIRQNNKLTTTRSKRSITLQTSFRQSDATQ